MKNNAAVYWIFQWFDRLIGTALIFGISLGRMLFASKKKHPRLSPDPRKVLLVKLSMMGDTILLIPALRELRKTWKNAHITIFCSEINEGVLRACGYLDRIVVLRTSQLLNPFSVLFMMRQVWDSYDVGIDFEQWFRFSAILLHFLGPKFTVGFKSERQYRHYLFDEAVPLNTAQHTIDCYFNLLDRVGVDGTDKRLEMPIDSRAISRTKEKLRHVGLTDASRFVIIHPGSSRWKQKQWPEKNYAALADLIVEKYGIKVVITGGKSEKPAAISIARSVRHSADIFSYAGDFSFEEMACALKMAAALVCGNTGVLHLGSAVGTPLVHISGPVDETLWGPRQGEFESVRSNLSCAPCVQLGFEYLCNKSTCMSSISVEDVEQAFARLLKRVQIL